MHPDLDRCLRALSGVLRSMGPGADEPRAPGKWSMAQVIEHLDLTFTKSAAGIARRLQKGDAPARKGSFRQAVARFVVVRLGYFPAGRKSPETVLPTGRPLADVAAGLEEHLRDLDRRMMEAEQRFGASTPILDHPIMGPFSVNDWRRFHWVHTRHHLRQLSQKPSTVKA